MKKNFMTLAAVLCCAMTMALFSACLNDNNDNPTVPSGGVNKGIVIDLNSTVIKPYLQFGASLADVEKYMKENYPDWTDNDPDALNEYQQQGGTTWKKTYTKNNSTIKYLFGNDTGGSLLLVSYGFNSPISLPAVKTELERNGFTYEGILKFDDYDADICNLFLSADKTIEAQLSYWAKDGGSWSLSFQNLDENDLQFLVPGAAAIIAYDAQIDGIYYKFSTDEATVTYQQYQQEYQDGELIENYISDYTGDIVIPETVAYNGKTYHVTTIGNHAFFGCGDVTSITIPESVDSIGNYAFRHCASLTSLAIPESVVNIGNCAIADCENLVSVNIPSKVTTLSMGLFIRDNSLASITIPETVDSIGSWTFYGCSSLSSVNIPKGVKSLEYSVFAYCTGLTALSIPEGVTIIDEFALQGCTGLTTIAIPEGVTSIGDAAFTGCTNLSTITIPKSVTSIGIDTFRDCSSLTSVIIPKGVTTINECTFLGCSSLTSITIPEGMTSIKYQAFYGCKSLTSITLPESLTTIEGDVFCGCTGLTVITIPKNVTSIGTMILEMCYGLESIIVEEGNTVYDSRGNCNALIETATNTLLAGCQKTVIPEGITTISLAAFFRCYPLTSITIPEGVTKMYDGAFQETGLTTVSIPSTMTFIDNCVFQGCTSLTQVYCHAENIPETGETAFDEVPFASATLYVPAGSVDKYKAVSPWNKFGNIKPLNSTQQ